ncbi:MAG: TIR domain-containing protein [Deltaproteobacteria bacterium]|nr:TIR domain-containing protein [Deltaproteobacteria bacterium]
MSRIFISYAHEDFDWAHRIYTDLFAHGISCWLDKMDLLPGQNWNAEIQKAIRNSKYFIALISSNSVDKRGYVQKELRLAMEEMEKMPYGGIYLIPVRIDGAGPRDQRLESIQYCDLFPDYDVGLRKILEVVAPEHYFLLQEKFPLGGVSPSTVTYSSAPTHAPSEELRQYLDISIGLEQLLKTVPDLFRRSKIEMWTVCIADIDNLTQINKLCGALVGDRVIWKVAHYLKSRLSPTIPKGRCGHDTFFFVFQHLSHRASEAACYDFHRRVYGFKWAKLSSKLRQVSLSIGYAPRKNFEPFSDTVIRAANAMNFTKMEKNYVSMAAPYLLEGASRVLRNYFS